MCKTWICTIFGGGTPTYLVSAESEKRAWELIRQALEKWYGGRFYLSEDKTGGLIEVPYWHADEERVDDVQELYAEKGVIKKGSFEGF